MTLQDGHGARISLVSLHLTGREEDYLHDAITSGVLCAGGKYGTRCETWLQDFLGGSRVFLTSSCTASLHLAGQALSLRPGDEIIVPSYSFASCASVFASLGARVVFADSRPDTLNIDERIVEALLTSRTRALLVVHYAGIACDMDALCDIAARAGIALIEDCAHGLFATYRGRPLGTFGDLAAFSFDYAKNVTCGEGGALAVNTPSLIRRVEVAYQRGTNRAELMRGESKTYSWLDAGGNYGASELQAAFLLAQLEEWTTIQCRRRSVWQAYATSLQAWADSVGVLLPTVPPECDPSYHVYALLLPTPAASRGVAEHLAKCGIESATHYFPLHLSPGAAVHGGGSRCPNVERFHARVLRIPLHANLQPSDIRDIVSSLVLIRSFDPGLGAPYSESYEDRSVDRA